MLRMVFLCLLLMGYVVSAFAGTVTFTFGGSPVTLTTTAGQDTFLADLLIRANAQRALRSPPESPFTLEEYLRDILVATLGDYKRQAERHGQRDACANFAALTGSQRNAIVTTLGGRNPCP